MSFIDATSIKPSLCVVKVLGYTVLYGLAVTRRLSSFFFSSRRRHTRWPRDWSSDVCSSDLHEEVPTVTLPDSPRDALILGGNRLPFARSGGPYAGISNQDLLTAALEGLVARYGLQGEKLGEVAGGAVLKLAGDLNLTRESALGTPLDPRTPALDMSKACASGLETTVHVSNRIRLGQIDSAIACGVDSASDSPIEVTPRLRRILHRAFAAKTTGQRLKALTAIRPGDLAPVPPRNGEPRTGLSMGEHMALTAAEWGITREAQDELAMTSHHKLAAAYDAGFFDDLVTGYRGPSQIGAQRRKARTAIRPGDLAPVPPRNGEPRAGLSMGEHMALTAAEWGITREAQDELAMTSHHKLAAAYDAGFFDDLVTGYRGLSRDQNLRPDSTLEKLASLKPVFGVKSPQVADPTMTAGNSTPLSDGASAVLLGSAEWAAEHELKPLARVVDSRMAAVDFAHGDEGLLMAPAYAVPELLDANGLSLQDIDLYEIHEAFASTVLAHMAAWESEQFCRTRLGRDGALGAIDRSRLNVAGSSLAAGHPFAATGGRIVASLAKLLHERHRETGQVQRGLISVCAAAGQGTVALIESVDL